MQRYSSGSTSCDGLFHNHTNSSSSFSMIFSVPPPNYKPYFDHEPDHQMYSSVDCTLSLGTPSTRLPTISDVEKRVPHRSAVAARVPNCCWEILQGKHAPDLPTYKHGRGSSTNSSNDNSAGGGDPLLARRCANCDTTSTPLWRNGPRGPKSLCNACGIRFKKEERRASAATTGAGAASGVMEPQRMLNTSCVHYSQSTQKVPCFSPAIGNEFRFIDGDDRDAAGIPFLSRRLNVTDRPGLVHD